MKFLAPIFFAFLLAGSGGAQEVTVQPAEIIQAVRDFLQDNLDEQVLEAVGVDQERVRQFLGEWQRRFDGTNVFDLRALRQTAVDLLPVLGKFEETQPYAAWLETRLDYLNVLEELQRETGPASKFPGGVLPNPSPAVERKVWTSALQRRTVPPHATKYISILKPIFVTEQVPPELVWLAEVESSFNPAARSPVGAAGLFQLMPATAKSLNLSLFPRDERLHPEKNGRAAASYLRYLHGRFGDWRLALAAYNAGESRVAGLLKKHKTQTFDSIARDLPAETQMYVPRVEATVRKREGYALADLKSPKR